jgi:hypothetical protein
VRKTFVVVLLALFSVVGAACGETVSADQRVERCLGKQPDATKSDCEKWEKDGELRDNGTHENHEES